MRKFSDPIVAEFSNDGKRLRLVEGFEYYLKNDHSKKLIIQSGFSSDGFTIVVVEQINRNKSEFILKPCLKRKESIKMHQIIRKILKKMIKEPHLDHTQALSSYVSGSLGTLKKCFYGLEIFSNPLID